MTHAKHTTQETPSERQATGPALPDPVRLMGRLDGMEALLRAHQGQLRSRLDALGDELAHAGLDVSQQPEPGGAHGAHGSQGAPAGRPRRPRVDRTV